MPLDFGDLSLEMGEVRLLPLSMQHATQLTEAAGEDPSIYLLEIGCTWLSKSATRTPCNSTAKFLLLCHAFEHWQVLRVSFQTDERNAISRAAIEMLGAKLALHFSLRAASKSC